MQIHDIRPGRSGDQEIVQGVKKVVGIVATQKRVWHQAQGAGAGHGVAIGERSGSWGGAIRAVCATAQDDHAVETGNVECRRQGKFLIAPSEAVAMQRHRGFAPRQHACRRRQGFPAVPYLPGNSGVHTGDLPRFSLIEDDSSSVW